ncbi:MAG: inorganic pyrophosphatase [Myxococcota bacterium]
MDHDPSLTDPLLASHLLFRAHPWHGVPIGPRAPEQVTCFIEVLPTDAVKYEVDKRTGHLKVDRPQKFSNRCPNLYGFIPQTWCEREVGAFCDEKTGRSGIIGDGDPMDVCVLSERNIHHGGILLQAIPIGGLRMIDGNEADDKIIAVLVNDALFGEWRDIEQVPRGVIDRLRHYFLTYKQVPGDGAPPKVEITHVYGREEALAVIECSRRDYLRKYGKLADTLSRLGE